MKAQTFPKLFKLIQGDTDGGAGGGGWESLIFVLWKRTPKLQTNPHIHTHPPTERFLLMDVNENISKHNLAKTERVTHHNQVKLFKRERIIQYTIIRTFNITSFQQTCRKISYGYSQNLRF